jgi:enamine deaminase RidA (YjgF/YER057c/UK114 family)
MPPPHPAWTAVGTTGLALDTGVVEIQAIAHV